MPREPRDREVLAEPAVQQVPCRVLERRVHLEHLEAQVHKAARVPWADPVRPVAKV